MDEGSEDTGTVHYFICTNRSVKRGTRSLCGSMTSSTTCQGSSREVIRGTEVTYQKNIIRGSSALDFGNLFRPKQI